MELDYKAIGKRIKIARIKADLTQEKLSEMVGVSPTHLSNIETGTTRVSLNAKVQFEKDIALILEDCDEYEIRIIRDMAAATKETLRCDAHLRKLADQ